MNPESSRNESPFAALSYQEQQDRWLAWRSRQLDYRPAAPGTAAAEKGTADRAVPEAPPLRLPHLSSQAPVRRRELDQVLSHHAQAAKRAGVFQPTGIE